MNDTMQKLLIALISLIAGHLLSRWWNRAKPLIVLRGFQENRRMDETVAVPDELFELTKDSWFVRSLEDRNAPVVDVESVYNEAQAHISASKDAERCCTRVIELLERAENSNEIASAFKELLEHQGVRDMLEGATLFETIPTQASVDYAGDSIITVSETDDANGSFDVLIHRRVFRLGSGLQKEAWRKTRLTKLLNAIAFADKGVMLQLLRPLLPLISEQREVHRKIVEVAGPVIEGKTHWICKLTMVNCGGSPMIVWPTADLLVRDPKTGAKLIIACKLAIEKSEEEDIRDLTGVRVVSPAESIGVWAATEKTQDMIERGGTLRSLYEAGNVNAQVSLTIARQGWPFGSRVTSSKALFINA